MRIDWLALDDFRSYAYGELHPAPGINLLSGDNAQGKTNLIEAIYYLGGAKSFRGVRDAALIRRGAQHARIRAHTHGQGRPLEFELTLARQRNVRINGVRKRRVSDLYGMFQCVLFGPEDLHLVREGAQARRRFMDGALSQLRPGYAVLLAEYNRLLAHKTRILRDRREKPSLLDALDEFSYRMCEVGARLIPYRFSFVRALAQEAATLHADISGGRETLHCAYRTVSAVEDASRGARELAVQLWAHAQEMRAAELSAGMCLSGVHKDEIEITIDGESARAYASQGQTRTAALSLKLAERRLFYRDTGEYPVLLLDDVLSELDRSRQEYVLQGIREGQVFITSCDPMIARDLQDIACSFTGCDTFRAFSIRESTVFPVAIPAAGERGAQERKA